MLVEFEVVERARAGDPVGFNELVTAYRRRIFGIVSRMIGRPEDVEDVAQEVFLRLYFSLDQLRSPEVFEPWLYRLTVNAALDYLRKRKKRRLEARVSDLSEQQVMMADAAAGTMVQTEDRQRARTRELVDSLLSGVSEEDRLLLTLKEVEGLSLKELEKIYHVNENALKVRLFRARQRVLKVYAAARGESDAQPRSSVEPREEA
ncbi:MAG: sigma-70 family RNA polymerase sigma factor [Acidobacteria bacterium]|nr:sigma-70 family RNA polymerase sigma factor [Acidobacteriota bacterium]